MTQFPGPWSLVVEKSVVVRVLEGFDTIVCKPRFYYPPEHKCNDEATVATETFAASLPGIRPMLEIERERR